MATSIQELFTTAKVTENGCTITQVAPDFYRICTPVPKEAFPPYGFTFCSFLVNDEHPLLVHTGMKQLFPGVKAAVERVIPIEKLRYIFSSHHEGDEDGSLLQWLEAAPKATLVAHTFGQMLHWTDMINGKREITTLNEGSELNLGKYKVRFIYTPHFPHGWETGYLFETNTSTLFSGDIITTLGSDPLPIVDTEDALFVPKDGGPCPYGLGASPDDPFEDKYFVRNRHTSTNFDKLCALQPKMLLCMHGASYKGDGAAALRRMEAGLK